MKVLTLISTFLIGTLLYGPANAMKVGAEASVEIVDPVSVSSVSEFSTVEMAIPFKIIGNLIKSYSEPIPQSEYFVTRADDTSVQLIVESLSNESGVEVYNLELNNTVNSGNKTSFKVDGRLQISSNAKPGRHSPEFEVAIYYE